MEQNNQAKQWHPTRYVVLEKTIEQMESLLKDKGTYNREVIFEKSIDIDIDKLTEREKQLQTNNRWYADEKSSISIEGSELYELVKKTIQDEMCNTEAKTIIQDRVYAKVLSTKIRAFVTFAPYEEKYLRLCVQTEIGDRNNKYEYSDDMEEIEEKMQNVRHNATYYSGGKAEYVRLERMEISVYPHSFKNASETIKKLINKVLRSDYTYCIKSGHVIVPQEYLDKGEEGIKEWRQIKSSNNKSNSMESRLLKQVYIDKKKFLFMCMTNIVDIICKGSTWTVPSLHVDGRWNKSKIEKLINQLLKDKTRQEIINMPKKEASEIFKKYWKNKLMDAYNNIDKLELKEEYHDR